MLDPGVGSVVWWHSLTGGDEIRCRIGPRSPSWGGGLCRVYQGASPLPPYPYTHAFHLVYRGSGVALAADDWTDTEGQVVRSALLSAKDVASALSSNSLGKAFLGAATD